MACTCTWLVKCYVADNVQAMRFPPKSYNKDLESAEVRCVLLTFSFTFSFIIESSWFLLQRRLCFHFVCLLVSRLMQKLLNRLSQLGRKLAYGQEKKPLSFGGNLHHVTLRFGWIRVWVMVDVLHRT